MVKKCKEKKVNLAKSISKSEICSFKDENFTKSIFLNISRITNTRYKF